MEDETNGAIDLKDVRKLARGASTLKKLTSLFGGKTARRSVPRSAAKKARKTRAAKTVEVPGLGKVPASTVKKWAPTIGGLILGRMLTRSSSGGGSRRRRARPSAPAQGDAEAVQSAPPQGNPYLKWIILLFVVAILVWWLADGGAQVCADAGKHIHMDKPASGTPAEFGRFLDTAEAKRLVVQMGYMYRYNPAVQRVFEAVRNGELGEIYSINAEMSTFHAVPYKKWLTNFGGGIMYILGSHLVDLIVYLLGKPERITSFFRRTGLDGVEFDDNDLAVLEYEKALARIFVSSVEVNGWGRRQLVVAGSRGTADIVPLENECRMSWADTSFAVSPYKDQKRYIPVEDLPPSCRYDGMMQDFHAYITGKKTNPFTYAHDRLVQEVLDEIVGGARFYGHDIGQ